MTDDSVGPWTDHAQEQVRRPPLSWLRMWPVSLIDLVALASAWHVRGTPANEPPSANVAAIVGTTPISFQDLGIALAQVTLDLQPHTNSDVRREALDKLVDEELIFQYGMRNKIYESDPFVRLAIVRAMLPLTCSPFQNASGIAIQSASFESARTSGTDSSACADSADGNSPSSMDRYLMWLRTRADVTEARRP